MKPCFDSLSARFKLLVWLLNRSVVIELLCCYWTNKKKKLNWQVMMTMMMMPLNNRRRNQEVPLIFTRVLLQWKHTTVAVQMTLAPTGTHSNALLMHQSIPPAPSPPAPSPGADPRGISIFFCLGWQIPGGGDSWAVKSPGMGTKKEGKCPVLRQHCNIFHWSHSQTCHFKYFNVRFFVSINVFLCNSARILIKTSRRDDMHQFMVLVLI